MMLIENAYEIGQKVYLSTDKEQEVRIITGILIKVTGIQYELACGKSSSWHYEMELSKEKDVLIATS